MEYILPLILIAFIALREYQNSKERRDLCDRLMAKDLPEYKEAQTPEEPTLVEEDDETLPIEQAEEEIMGDGEEE